MFLSVLSSQNLHWANHMGGTDTEYAYSISVDDSGNIYVTGAFSGTVDFDPGSGTLALTAIQGYDIFIQKLDLYGNLIWVKQIEGTGIDDRGSDMDIPAGSDTEPPSPASDAEPPPTTLDTRMTRASSSRPTPPGTRTSSSRLPLASRV